MPFDDFDESGRQFFRDDFTRALDRFVETCLKPFSEESALEDMGFECTDDNISDVWSYLFRNPLVFRGYFEEDSDARWLTRAGLFQGKEFAVKVTKMEIASGIFIPASRCIPFANPEIPPSKYRFYSGKKALPRTVVDAEIGEIAPFYALAGEEAAPEAIAADGMEHCDDIADVIGSAGFIGGGGTFPLNVVDMREFYWHHQVKPGDYLVIKVANWRVARFSVRVRRQDENAEDVEKWREAFWRFLKNSFEDAGPCGRIEQQLAEAFFSGRNSELFTLPPDDISNAIELSPDIRFFPYGMETRLWKEGQDFPVYEDWQSWLEDVLCDGETGVFDATRFPAPLEVIYAYMRDALWRKEDDPAQLVERLCKINGGKTTKACRAELERLVSQGYYSLSQEYNVFEDITAGLRSGFLDFYSRIVSLARFCQAAGATPEDLNTQHMLVLTQFSEHVADSLRAICYSEGAIDAEKLPPADSLSAMSEFFADLEVSLKSEAENCRNSRA